MATPHQTSDRSTSTDLDEGLNILVLDAKQRLGNQDVVAVGLMRNGEDQLGSLSSVGDPETAYSSNAFASHAQLHSESEALKWGSYFPNVNAEGLENDSTDVYNETPSLGLYDSGHSSQMQQRHFASLSSQLPSVIGHSQLYNGRYFPTPDPPYHQQLVPQSLSYATSPVSVSHSKFPVNIEVQGEERRFMPTPNCLTLLGSYGRGSNLFGNSSKLSFSGQGCDSFEAAGFHADWLKPLNSSSLFQLSYPEACPEPVTSLEFPRNEFGLGSFQKASFHGFGSCSSLSSRGYSNIRSDLGCSYGSTVASSLGINGKSWPTLDEARQARRCNDFSCSCTVALDTLSERNRGPRAFKPKGQTANGLVINNCRNEKINGISTGLYNEQDFITDYKDARFFVIKSYSEDNVHKSIKYGVWASTPSGNKKLDAAYHEAKGKQNICPVFLLFSVNASSQFCGVAEMVGSVDFDKSVDYWLQDKWSGHFPVRWHIIKDVPNSQFRHILVRSNDNKPVTNSRDTQEVELEQGIEMLNIFKNYGSYSSILDDFYFYEERQKAMQERKSRQQASLAVSPEDVVSESHYPVSLSNDIEKKMTKSFAQAVLLNGNDKEDPAAGKVLSTLTSSTGRGR
ncbi:hypothetical protein SLEP1_g25584 [Rubroshorea leprosula]|uniref:YTH domain-containing family protein n=1 Tax=Rubroshorea leprosula TaxID=152421 RepID=A0AAV5JT74_9ROSI|nr:hypothetical protein SLEP1_g25584 [Rubroshorea leprosula]